MWVRLNKEQLKLLADFTKDLSIFFFGTVIAPVFAEVDNINPLMLVLGVSLATGFLYESLLLLKGFK